MQLYRMSAELYMVVSIIIAPISCVLGWILVGKTRRKGLYSFLPWMTPSAITSTFVAIAVILLAYVTFFDRRAYDLAAISYLLTILGILLNVAAFVAL